MARWRLFWLVLLSLPWFHCPEGLSHLSSLRPLSLHSLCGVPDLWPRFWLVSLLGYHFILPCVLVQFLYRFLTLSVSCYHIQH